MKKFKFKINGSEYEVSINEVEENYAEIEVNGTPFSVEIEKQVKTSTKIFNKKPAGKVNPINTPSRAMSASPLKSPLPGTIMKVLVTPGQLVQRGDIVLTMESMKMENNILAEHDAVVKKVYVQTGQNVMQDDLLVDFNEVAVVTELPITEENKEDEVFITEKPSTPSPKPIPPPTKSKGVKSITSPLPGNVLKVLVKVGQTVDNGELLLTLESMKMENNILSEKAGVIKFIHVVDGQTVMQDDPLFDFE
jgi:glutaconyl-CoA/methylmalonyl-CoA decarboxylase subunit gamma